MDLAKVGMRIITHLNEKQRVKGITINKMLIIKAFYSYLEKDHYDSYQNPRNYLHIITIFLPKLLELNIKTKCGIRVYRSGHPPFIYTHQA